MSDDIILKFTNANILINDKAYERIITQENSIKFTESLIEDIVYSNQNIIVLTEEILDQYLEKNSLKGEINEEIIPETVDVNTTASQSKFQTGRPFDFHVIQDTTKKSYTSGEVKDFITYFNSRYEQLHNILNKRRELKDHRPINRIGKNDDALKIIGMVNDIKNTKNGHKIIELEDETGSISVLVHNENHQLYEKAEKIVRDEVIGIIGSKKGTLVIASDIVQPGVPRIDEKPMDFGAVFISDVHIGSSTFLDDAFNRFIKWINGDFGDDSQQEIANDVKYLVLGGDTVDGIGIYPNQEKELTIKDIYEQYSDIPWKPRCS